MRYLSTGFYRFQASSFLNMFALRMFQLTLAWWTLDVTGSTDHFSYVLALGICLEVGVNLCFGWLGDYRSRKAIYFISVLLTGISSLLFLMLYSLADFALVYVLTISGIMGLANGIRMPIEGSIIPELVSKSDVAEAITQKSTIYAVGNITGPIAAGFLLELVSIGPVLALSIFLSMCSMVLTLLINKDVRDTAKHKTNNYSDTLLTRSTSGLKILFHTKSELYMACLSVIINFTLSPLFMLLIPAFVKLHLNSEAWNIALIEIGFSFGVLLGSSKIVSLINQKVGRYLSVVIGVVLLSVCMFGFVIIGVPIALTFTMFLGGVGLMLYNINASVVRTIATPDSHQSRMQSSVIVMSSIANPIGILVCGLLISLLGIINTLLIFSVIVFLCAPLLYLIPNYQSIMGMSDDELNDIYKDIYPKAF